MNVNRDNVVIIGGGVAGLSAAAHCAELGLKTILIEAGSYPAHKVCGEFFSPECLPLLKRWGIEPSALINQMQLITAAGDKLFFTLPSPAGSISRFVFDHCLMQRAVACGAQVLTETMVQSIESDGDGYQIFLSSGEKIASDQLIIGTGRVLQLLQKNDQKALPLPYVGIKVHFHVTDIPSDQVFFYIFNGGYLGISKVATDTVNLACLVRRKKFEQFNSDPTSFIDHLAASMHDEVFKKVVNSPQIFPWLTTYVPEFGIRLVPLLPNVYFIGDAAGAIPPATGDGLALAMFSGQMVASYVQAGDAAGFRRDWQKRYKNVFRNGLLLHKMMMLSWGTKLMYRLGSYFPKLVQIIFNKTRLL